MSKFNRVFAAAVLLAGLPMAALAQVPVNVQVTVAQTCSVSVPSNADFGSQSPTGVLNLTTTGAVTLTCNRGALPQVSVSNGGNFGGGTRNMVSGGNLVAYSVKKPTIDGANNFTVCGAHGAGDDWGSALLARLAAGAAFNASGGPRTVNLCFQTTVDQNTAVATYTDTVVVSVGF